MPALDFGIPVWYKANIAVNANDKAKRVKT